MSKWFWFYMNKEPALMGSGLFACLAIAVPTVAYANSTPRRLDEVTPEVYDPSKAYTDPAYPRSDPRTPKFEADRLLEYHNSKDGPYRSQSAPQNALSKHLNSLSPEEAEKLRRVLAVNAGDDLRIAVLDSAADQRMYNPEDVQAAADAGGARLVRAQIRALGGAPLAPTPASHRA